MKNSPFYQQARLLIDILPHVQALESFALKGGTALNFFVQNLPRLSVDIDLTYIPFKDRNTDFDQISQLLGSLQNRVNHTLDNVKIFTKKTGKHILALQIVRNHSIVKIEPNLVIRGTVFSPEQMTLSDQAQKLFGAYVKMTCLAIPDLYGGKIYAALDRQHPRDLFDIKLLLERIGISDPIRRAFIVYLISHSRPIAELLDPHLIDIEPIFNKEFRGMTLENIPYSELLDARKNLIHFVRNNLTKAERQFILSFKMGVPEWELLGLENIQKLPAVQWKLLNIRKMDKVKHKAAVEKLRRAFDR